MRMSNCLIYALLKRFREGGRIRMRRSEYGWWPHFFHESKNGVTTHFRARHPGPRRCPPLLFRGRGRRLKDK